MKWVAVCFGLLVSSVPSSAQPALPRDLISAAAIDCQSGTTRMVGSFGGHAFGSAYGPSIVVTEGFWFPSPGGASWIAEESVIRYAFHLSPPFPNPARSRASISYSVPGAGDQQVPVRIDIFDVTGRRIVTLANQTRTPGPHSEQWLGRDAAGHPVAPGVYYCHLQAGPASATRTLIVLK